MSPRDNAIDMEARALWRALRDEAPPEHLHGPELLAAIVSDSAAPTHDRLCSPYPRPTLISRPLHRP